MRFTQRGVTGDTTHITKQFVTKRLTKRVAAIFLLQSFEVIEFVRLFVRGSYSYFYAITAQKVYLVERA